VATVSLTINNTIGSSKAPTVVVLSDKASEQVLGSVAIPPSTFKSGWTLVFTPAKKTKADKQTSKKGSKGCDKGKKGDKKEEEKKGAANQNLTPGFSVQAYDENGKPRDVSDLPNDVEISLYATLPKNFDKVSFDFDISERIVVDSPDNDNINNDNRTRFA